MRFAHIGVDRNPDFVAASFAPLAHLGRLITPLNQVIDKAVEVGLHLGLHYGAGLGSVPLVPEEQRDQQPDVKRVYLDFPATWEQMSDAEKREAALKMADVLRARLRISADDS